MITGRQHIESMFIQCLEIEGNKTLQFAYDYYTGFYTLDTSEIVEIHKELVRTNLVHSIDPVNGMKHRLKDMPVTQAIQYLERFK